MISQAFRGKLAVAAVAWSMLVLAAFAAAQETGKPRILPDFGVILTDDGVLSFTDMDPMRSEAALRTMIRSLRESPVKTLVYEVAAGSQVMFYPTKVGSRWGWRKTGMEADPAWQKRMPINRAAAQNELDAVRTAGRAAKELGLYFMPGYRINDAHFAHDPLGNVLTGEFWVRHHERLALGSSPVPGDALYQHLFDFSHAEVRAQCRAVVFELIERYADIMDGIQLDFMRHPVFFPAGTGPARAALLTEMVASIRQRLDDAGRRGARTFALSVRVPPTLATCRQAGVAIDEWLVRRLVDIVIPSPSITLSHDMPVDEFVALAKPVGVKIFPALFPRTQFHWPVVRTPSAQSYVGATGRDVTEGQVRGAVVNYLSLGAAGFELYNFNLPPQNVAAAAFQALSRPRAGERIYAITPAYWSERESLFEYRKQIPARLAAAMPCRLTIMLGEDLSRTPAKSDHFAALRLGISGLGKTRPEFVITINDTLLHKGPGEKFLTPIQGRPSRPSRLHPPNAQLYLQIPLTDRRIFRLGRNELTIQLKPDAAAREAQIVEAQIILQDILR